MCLYIVARWQFVFKYCGQMAICVCILWPGGNLCLFIVARWQSMFVSKVLPPRLFLPSSQQPGDMLHFPARCLDLHRSFIDFDFWRLSQLCKSLTKVFAASSHPRIGWIEHEGGVEVAITSMAHNWSRQSVPFSVVLIFFFGNFRSMFFQILLWLPKHLKISSLAARTISGRLDIGTHTSVAKSLFCWVRKEFSEADVSNGPYKMLPTC